MTRPRKIKTSRVKSGLIATDHSKSWDNRSNAGILWCWSGQSQNLGVGSMGLVGLWHGSMSPERLESLVGSWSYLNISSPWWLGAMLSMFCIVLISLRHCKLQYRHENFERNTQYVDVHFFGCMNKYIILHMEHTGLLLVYSWGCFLVMTLTTNYWLHWFAPPEASSHTQTSTPTSYPTKTSTYAILQLVFSRSFLFRFWKPHFH